MQSEETLPAENESHPPITEEQIRALAYDLWERDGGPYGRSEEYWERARRQLTGDAATLEQSQGDSEA